jgi:hypothetical protein
MSDPTDRHDDEDYLGRRAPDYPQAVRVMETLWQLLDALDAYFEQPGDSDSRFCHDADGLRYNAHAAADVLDGSLAPWPGYWRRQAEQARRDGDEQNAQRLEQLAQRLERQGHRDDLDGGDPADAPAVVESRGQR